MLKYHLKYQDLFLLLVNGHYYLKFFLFFYQFLLFFFYMYLAGLLAEGEINLFVAAAAIGGVIAVTAIIIHKELLLPIICFVFLVESVSVILQTEVAKYGNKRGLKLRVFKRAPLHDTFRVKPGQIPANFKVFLNWPRGCWLESKVTVRFWIVTIMMAALAIVTLKIR